MKQCHIATEQGHLTLSEDGTFLLYSESICYDIAIIGKNTRDKMVEILNAMEYAGDTNDNI